MLRLLGKRGHAVVILAVEPIVLGVGDKCLEPGRRTVPGKVWSAASFGSMEGMAFRASKRVNEGLSSLFYGSILGGLGIVIAMLGKLRFKDQGGYHGVEVGLMLLE